MIRKPCLMADRRIESKRMIPAPHGAVCAGYGCDRQMAQRSSFDAGLAAGGAPTLMDAGLGSIRAEPPVGSRQIRTAWRHLTLFRDLGGQNVSLSSESLKVRGLRNSPRPLR